MTFLNRHRSRIRPVGPFAPSSLFFGGIPGAWYDPTDLSTMFQDTTGLTPVTAVEQPVGLIFDKSQGTPAARYNLLTFSEQFDDASWSKVNVAVTSNATVAPDGTTTADRITAAAGASVKYVGSTPTASGQTAFSFYVKAGTHGIVQLLNTGDAGAFANFDVTTGTIGVVGTKTTATIQNVGSGWFRCVATFSAATVYAAGWRLYQIPSLASGYAPSWTTAGTETTDIWGAQLEVGSTATTYQRITTGTGGEWTPGNHASQSTAASRPTYRARYNMVEQSEVFNNAWWTKIDTTISSDAGVAPDGTTTADLMYPTTSGSDRFVWRTPPIVGINGQSYTVSVYAKASGKSFLWFATLSGNTLSAQLAFFNLQTGQVTQVGAYFDAVTIQSVGSGWYRCTATKNVVTSANLYPIFGVSNASGSSAVTTNGTDGILIWGAQLLTAADVTATGNAYQRIAAATVYDTAPVFRPYLAFDGMDDSLSTAAINFTSTDKMSVFSGVTKSSDAGTGMVAELSVDAGANNGAFYLAAPNSLGDNFGFLSRGTAARQTVPTGFAAPTTSVLTALTDIAAPSLALRRNSTQIGSSALSQGTGTFGNYAMFIGRRNNSIYPLNGRIYSLIVRGAASSITEIADTELWVNARTGAF